MCARRGFEYANQYALVTSNVEVVDWCHWNSLIADCATNEANLDWQELLHHVNRAFPGAPTFDLLNMHRAMDSGHWPSALASATSLHANFPDQPDYGFMKGFCAFHSGDRVLALKSQVRPRISVGGRWGLNLGELKSPQLMLRRLQSLLLSCGRRSCRFLD